MRLLACLNFWGDKVILPFEKIFINGTFGYIDFCPIMGWYIIGFPVLYFDFSFYKNHKKLCQQL